MAILNQLGGVHKGCRLVVTLPKSLPGQRAGGHVTTALTLMDCNEDTIAFFCHDALKEDAVCSSFVEFAVDEDILFCLSSEPFGFGIIIATRTYRFARK